MRNQLQEQKDFYLIAKRIKNEQAPSSNDLDIKMEQRYQKQSEYALKMINAYRKVQNVKSNPSSNISKLNVKEKELPNSQQPKSTYANKIKQTLRQLNANKAKQYEKLSQRNSQLKSQKNINSLQIQNQMAIKSKSSEQKKLITKSIQKLFLLFRSFINMSKQTSFQTIKAHSQNILENQYQMARKYRIFRLFSMWREETKVLKIQNQRKKKENHQKQLEATQIAYEFHLFTTYKKVLKAWSKIAKMEKKKRKYENQLKIIQAQRKQFHNKQQQKIQKCSQTRNSNGQLQNKLKGFLNGLKQKIQHKQTKPNLHPIIELSQQSQRASNVYSQQLEFQQPQTFQHQQNQAQLENQQVQNAESQPQSQKQPLSNEELQKRRQQIYERSKNRKQALQKLKKQKQNIKKKEDQQRKQLEHKISEQQKRIKQLKYKEFQSRKKLEKQWDLRESQLNVRADAWNRLRIMKFYGFDQWKTLKDNNLNNTQLMKNLLQKIMIRHAGRQLFQNLHENLECVLQRLYLKMSLLHEKKLKRKFVEGFKRQLLESHQQKLQLEAFHEVHTQKIFLSQWKGVLDLLRFENMEQQRPLIKKANQYHRVSLLLKSLRQLKQNAVQCKKQKNINEQKLKIKSKIKNIISEKIEINYDEFL